jgi:hypothetical protein
MGALKRLFKIIVGIVLFPFWGAALLIAISLAIPLGIYSTALYIKRGYGDEYIMMAPLCWVMELAEDFTD